MPNAMRRKLIRRIQSVQRRKLAASLTTKLAFPRGATNTEWDGLGSGPATIESIAGALSVANGAAGISYPRSCSANDCRFQQRRSLAFIRMSQRQLDGRLRSDEDHFDGAVARYRSNKFAASGSACSSSPRASRTIPAPANLIRHCLSN